MPTEESYSKLLAERRAVIISGLSGSDEKAKRIKRSLYSRYADVAEAMYEDPVKDGLIRGNPEAYIVLCDYAVYLWAYTGRSGEEFREVASKHPSLNKLFSSINTVGIDGACKIKEVTGLEIRDITFEELVTGLSSFKADRIVPLMDDIETTEEDDGYFADEDEESADNSSEDDDFEEEIPGDIIDTSRNTDIDEDEFNPEVDANTARVMNVYKDLFEVGFELQIPYGILIKTGILTLTKSGKVAPKVSPSIAKLYELVNDITGKYLIQSEVGTSDSASKLRHIHIRKGTTYYPEFQLGNLYGILEDAKVDSWDALSRAIRPEVRKNIQLNIKEGRDISAIVDALTTCIVVSEFDANVAMKLRISVGNGLISKGEFEREYIARKSTILAGIGEIYHINQLQSGVLEVTIVFNKAAFNGRPLFAYEAVQDLIRRGRQPSLKEMILGQDTSGKIMTVNFNRQNACVVLIGAGQRSGKGVLTLNLLGTILSGGHPLVYLDGKPDMAQVLWDVGRKNGINPAVWDAFKPNGNIVGTGAPESVVRENREVLGVLMYLKAVQLMMAAAKLRATKGIMVGGEDKRPFFIFDEALAVQNIMSSTWQPLVRVAKDKKDESEEAQWSRHIVQWAEQLSSALVGTINSQLPMSGMSTVWLFQSVQPTSWNAFETEGLRGKFNILKSPIMSRSSIKLLGKGTTDSEYGLGSKDIKGNKLITERVVAEGGRHFVYTDAQKVTDMNLCKVFKPYLVLNTYENGTKAVEELRGNVSNDVWAAIAPNGTLDPGAGFEGFATLLGQQAIQNLALGREFLMEVMQHLGLTKYSSVDEYLYDANIDSFKSTGTLVDGSENDEDDSEEGEDGTYITGGGYSPSVAQTQQTGRTQQPQPERSTYTPGYTAPREPVDFLHPTGATRVASDRQMNDERAARVALDNDIEIGNTRKRYDIDDDNLIRAATSGELNVDDLVQILVDRKAQQGNIMTGRDGRTITVDTANTKNVAKLTQDNCIDCRAAGPGPLTWIEKMTLNTPIGAERYVKKIWQSILDTVVSGGLKRVNVTRVSLHGGQMYVNGKILNLNGVLGGYECIRLKDIVSFRSLFKFFFNVRELRTDEEMIRSAVAELGENPVEVFFQLATKLQYVFIQSENGDTIRVDRQTVQNQTVQRMMEKNKAKNDFDLHCMNTSKKPWSGRLAGDNIWGMNLAKNAMSNAGKMFMDRNKPSFGKAAIFATTGLLVGTVGGVAWGAARLAGGIFNLGKMFKK